MKILTSEEMRAVDRAAIEGLGIPGLVLMENAGSRVVEALEAGVPALSEERVVVVAGRGNNGGDGFVVARHLFLRGVPVSVLLVAGRREVRGDAAVNLSIADKLGIPVREVADEVTWRRHKRELAAATVVVDALFGTGLTKPLEGLFAAVVKDINDSRAFKVAVDIPSGLSGDSFKLVGPAVEADLTVALAAPKIAHLFPPAAELSGRLLVADIGIPAGLFSSDALRLELVEPDMVRVFFGPRKKDAHKGTFGHLLVVAGSLGKSGAAALCGRAALKTGAGLVTVATASSALAGVARSMMELMTEPLAETGAGTIDERALPRILELLRGKDGVLIGPGLSTDPSTARLVLELLPKVEVPMVLDADALNIIAADRSVLKRLKAPAVLTPHPGEFGRLTGLAASEVLKRRLELVPAFASSHRVHLVLKGYRTLVAVPDGRVFVNPTGNPGMATGGSGDVLSGMLAAQAVQEKDILGAALSAVFVHGLAGDLAADSLSEKAVTASDLIRFLPRALKELEGTAAS